MLPNDDPSLQKAQQGFSEVIPRNVIFQPKHAGLKKAWVPKRGLIKGTQRQDLGG